MNVADTSLEANMPEIQRQFNQLHSEVKTGHETVCEKVDGLANKIDDSLESRPTRAELAEDYAAMAIRMAGVSGAGMGTTTATTTTTTTRTTTNSKVWGHSQALLLMEAWKLATLVGNQHGGVISTKRIKSVSVGWPSW
jgi:hypothetical protein